MHSSYQVRESHYADLTLSIHDRINQLHRRAERLAPAVAESALDSGCTDQTRRSHGDMGPRQQKAWDLVAEAYGWNAISDNPELVAEAEQHERDGVRYLVGYGPDGLGITVPAAEPQPELTEERLTEIAAEGRTIITRGGRTGTLTGYKDQHGNPYVQFDDGSLYSIPPEAIAAVAQDPPASPQPGTDRDHLSIAGRVLAEPEPQPEPVPDGEYGKVTLLGPAPWGGTYTSLADDPKVAELLDRGYTVLRSWIVTWQDGKASTRDTGFDQAVSLARAYTDPVDHAAHRAAEARRRELDQAQHDVNRLYLNGEMTQAEWQAALAAITAER